MRFIQTLGLLIVSLTLAGCSPGGSSLATDLSNSSCPSGGCANITPDPSQLSIVGSGKTTLYQAAAAGDAIEVGGNCYPSTYPSNVIQVTAYAAGSNTPMPIATTDIVNISATTTTPKCSGGRFDIAINGAYFQPNQQYRLQFAIVGKDALGRAVPNSAGGQFSVNVVR